MYGEIKIHNDTVYREIILMILGNNEIPLI